ncbi:MAG: hypothetical protein ACE5JR_13795 [Gemmatimonadota bacterium]
MAEPPWILRHGLVVIGGRELGLPWPTVDQLVADVRQFHRDSALAVLLRLNLTLTHHRPLDQADLVGRWLPDIAERFLAVMREQKATVVFHEAQVLNLIRLVILYASLEAGRRCDQMGDFTLLARILLQLTDLLVGRDSQAEFDRRTWVFSSFTRTELFMHDEHRVPDAMARNYDLFVLVPRLLNRRGHSYNLPGTFARTTGLAIEDYIGLGFGLLSHYDTIDAGLLGHAEIGIDRARYLANVRPAAEVRDRLWPLVSKPLEEYRTALQGEWDRTTGAARWAAMRTFSQFPMIQLSSGPIVAVSRRLLRDRITHGIYWILANNLSGRERDDFTNFFGQVFETYICRSLIRAVGRRFHREVEYDGGHEGKRPEGALVTQRSVALVEAKARRLLLNVREIGGEAELRAAVEPGLDEAANQLATAIDAGRRGAIKDIKTGKDTRYYPVIITYEPLPSHPLALRLYEEIIHRGGRLKGQMIKPVTMLNTRDVESVEAIIQDGTAWPDFLTRKHTERHVNDSFHNYIYRAFAGGIPRNEYLRVRWERIGDMIGMRLFGETLDHSADARPRSRGRGHRRR